MWSGDSSTALIVAWSVGNIIVRSSHIRYSLSLVWLRAGQATSKCSSVPGVVEQEGDLQHPLLFLPQYLVSMSVLYRPEAMIASTVHLAVSYGLLAARLHM